MLARLGRMIPYESEQSTLEHSTRRATFILAQRRLALILDVGHRDTPCIRLDTPYSRVYAGGDNIRQHRPVDKREPRRTKLLSISLILRLGLEYSRRERNKVAILRLVCQEAVAPDVPPLLFLVVFENINDTRCLQSSASAVVQDTMQMFSQADLLMPIHSPACGGLWARISSASQ